MVDLDVLIICGLVLSITGLVAYIPPRIFGRLWKFLLSSHDSIPVPELESLLPIKAHGLIGAPAISFNARVRAYDKLPGSCLLFKERFFWWTTIVANDVKYLRLLDVLEKPARILNVGKTYVGEEAVMFQRNERAKRDHARLVKAFGNVNDLTRRLHSPMVEQAAMRLRERCILSQSEFGGFSVEDESVRIAVEITCEMLFGGKVYEDKSLFATFVGFAQLGIHPWLSYPLGSLVVQAIHYSYISGVDKHLMKVVEDRLSNKGKKEGEEQDILDLLVARCNPNEESIIEGVPRSRWIADQLKGLLLAGVLPLAHTMCWSFALIGLNLPMQDTIRSELDEYIINSSIREERPPAFFELPQLKYLDSFIKEVMRLFPAMPFLDRSFSRTTLDCVIDGIQIPPQSTLRVDLMSLHRRAEFFPSPSLFDPDRWMDKKKCKQQREEACVPFGYGSRSCIGKHLALHQLRVFFATMLRNHKLVPYDATQKLPDAFLTNGCIKCSPGFDLQIIGRFDTEDK